MQFILKIVMKKEFKNIWVKNGNVRENSMTSRSVQLLKSCSIF